MPTVSWLGALIDLLLILFVGLFLGMLGGELLAGGLMLLLVPMPEDPASFVIPGWAAQVAKGVWLGIVLAIAYYLQQRRDVSPTVFGWPRKRDSLGWHVLATMIALGATVAAWAFSAVLVVGIMMAAPHMMEDTAQSRIEFMSMIPRESWYSSMVLMLLVATQEELLFRGLLLPYLRRLSGSWLIAVMISCLIFAVLHYQQGVLGIIQIELLALAFAIVYITTRSLIAVIMAHFLFNFIQIQFIAPLIFEAQEMWQKQV